MTRQYACLSYSMYSKRIWRPLCVSRGSKPYTRVRVWPAMDDDARDGTRRDGRRRTRRAATRHGATGGDGGFVEAISRVGGRRDGSIDP